MRGAEAPPRSALARSRLYGWVRTRPPKTRSTTSTICAIVGRDSLTVCARGTLTSCVGSVGRESLTVGAGEALTVCAGSVGRESPTDSDGMVGRESLTGSAGMVGRETLTDLRTTGALPNLAT